jgi:hypothetical protein
VGDSLLGVGEGQYLGRDSSRYLNTNSQQQLLSVLILFFEAFTNPSLFLQVNIFCMTLDKVLTHSMPQFPHLYWEKKDTFLCSIIRLE